MFGCRKMSMQMSTDSLAHMRLSWWQLHEGCQLAVKWDSGYQWAVADTVMRAPPHFCRQFVHNRREGPLRTSKPQWGKQSINSIFSLAGRAQVHQKRGSQGKQYVSVISAAHEASNLAQSCENHRNHQLGEGLALHCFLDTKNRKMI